MNTKQINEPSRTTQSPNREESPLAPLMTILLFVLFIVGIVQFWEYRRQGERERVERHASKVETSLLKVLAAANYRQDGRGMQPTVVWSGEGATLLHSVHASYQSGIIVKDMVHSWQMLAKTPSGNYFSVLFYLKDRDLPCDENNIEKCVDQYSFSPIKADEIKAHVYRVYKDPALYKRLFNEDMPALDVKA